MQRTSTVNPPKVHAAHVDASGDAKSRRGGGVPAPLRFGIGAGVLLILLALLTFGYGFAHNDRVFRGVKVLGADLGGLSRAEARAAVTQASAGYPSGSMTLQGQGRTWEFAPADLGLTVDADKTIDAAMNVGRAGAFSANLGTQLSALFGGAQVTPVLKHDAALVDKAVARVAADIDKPAVDSKLERASDGSVHVTQSATGSVVDQAATRSAFAAALTTVPAAPAAVTMRESTPKVTESALKQAATHAALLTEQPVILRSGEQSWTLDTAQLRQMLDVSSPEAGSTEASVALGGAALTSYLQPVGDAVAVEPTDASVAVGKGTVDMTPDEDGAVLDTPAAVSAIQAAAEKSDAAERVVDLPLKAVPANVHTADVQALYDKANALVTQGVRLRFRDDGYIMRGSSVTGFIDVARTQGGPGYKLVVDEDVLADRIGGIAYNINRNAIDARFRMVNGVPTKIATAKEGYKVNVQNTLQNVLKSIDSYTGGDRLQIDMDVAVTAPTLADADLSAINTPDLLGSGQTTYANSSAERAWNVGLGTRNVDGALIPPGGTFSTVEAIGDLTLAAGFKMGYAIVNTGNGITTVPAEAGGICQVATTLFHSVFWAGLPVVERNWHSYWINLYGIAPSGLQGLDATIAPPEKDFRFKNTTGNWILIKATADGKNVTFQLYGVNPGWKVAVSGPVITNRVPTSQAPITEYSSALPAGKKVLVEHAQDGFSASITRVVRDSAGNVIDNWTARSTYAPAHNRTLIGTGK